MSIQMTIIFGVLVAEMAVLFGLVLPLPYVVRKNIIAFDSLIRANNNLKVLIVFITLLLTVQFVDCLQRLRKYTYLQTPYYATNQDTPIRGNLTSEQLASKFYSQRNLYITGAVLYLEVAIFTVMPIIKKLVAKEREYRELTTSQNAVSGSDEDEAEKLRQLIKQKDQDILAMKKQVQNLQTAYDGLTADETISKDD